MSKKLTLLHGGLDRKPVEEGPVSRMGLWEHYKPLSKKQLALIFIPKLVLLATIIYLMLSLR